MYAKETGMGSPVATVTYDYDSRGRMSKVEQTTTLPNTTDSKYVTQYGYYLDNSLASTVYPKAGIVTTCYDPMGREIWLSKSKTITDCTGSPEPIIASQAYVTGVQYSPHGAVSYESFVFNSRAQLTDLRLGSSATGGEDFQEQYDYGTAAANNGNIRKVILKPTGSSATIETHYQYDVLNRLKVAIENPVNPVAAPLCSAANTASWCREYSYDSRGNRATPTQQGNSYAVVMPTMFGSDNRVADAGWQYDTRGNLKTIPFLTATPDRLVYDGENRLAAYCSASAACNATAAQVAGRTRYWYDAAGRRVGKEEGGAVVKFFYGAGGNLVLEEGGTNGAPSGVRYLAQDHLGSTRVVADDTGAVKERYDFLPFGEGVQVSSGSPRSGVAGYGVDQTRIKFSGKERDAETGLDYFGARYMSAAQGRFTSPDAPFADQKAEDPQSWNL